jgi:hypothetical protein
MPRKNDLMTFDEAKARCLEALLDHIGEENPIGADVLYEKVFGVKITHKENHTRQLRTLVNALQLQGKRIGSNCSSNNGGYFIFRSASEFNEFGERTYLRPALKKLTKLARMKGITLPALMGQMVINFGESIDGK